MAKNTRSKLFSVLSAGAALAVALGALSIPIFTPTPQAQYEDIPVVQLSPGTHRLICPGALKIPSTEQASEVSYDLDLDTGKEALSGQTILTAIEPLSSQAATAVV